MNKITCFFVILFIATVMLVTIYGCLLDDLQRMATSHKEELHYVEIITRYLEEKYNENFEYTGERINRTTYSTFNIGPNHKPRTWNYFFTNGKQDVLVRITVDTIDDSIYTIHGDNYMDYRFIDELNETLSIMAGEIYDDFKVIREISTSSEGYHHPQINKESTINEWLNTREHSMLTTFEILIQKDNNDMLQDATKLSELLTDFHPDNSWPAASLYIDIYCVDAEIYNEIVDDDILPFQRQQVDFRKQGNTIYRYSITPDRENGGRGYEIKFTEFEPLQ